MSETAEQVVAMIQKDWDPQFAPPVMEFIPWTPWHTSIEQAKVTLISTGGIYLKHGLHEPFALSAEGGDCTFREFPSVVSSEDLAVAHRMEQPYAVKDVNVTFPLQRLHELADAGYVGTVAPFAYSFMGHVTQPTPLLSNYALSVAYRLKRMGADLALVITAGLVDHYAAAIVARAAELAGVPTLVLGTNRALLAELGVPRAVTVRHPASAPLGNPGNSGKHQLLLREALAAGWEFEGPGLITELPFAWSGE